MDQIINKPASTSSRSLITIEPATKEHAYFISQITKEAFKKYVVAASIPGSIAALTETLEDVAKDIEEKKVFLAKVGNEPAGSIRITLNPDATAYISRFGVLCKYQNIGIGKLLMEAANKLFLENNIKSARLHTAADYSELVSFYIYQGFRIIEITNDTGYPRALLQKDL